MGLEILTWRFWMKSILNQSIYFSSMCFPMSVTAVYTNAISPCADDERGSIARKTQHHMDSFQDSFILQTFIRHWY